MQVRDAQRRTPGKGRLPAPFVVGTGRSGTTLLRMMLDAHSQLAIPPETNFAEAVEAFQRGGVDDAVAAVLRSQVWKDCDLPKDEYLGRVRQFHRPHIADVLRVFYELYAARHGKSRWGDKSPYYVFAMEKIQLWLPEARFVHVIRDGRDYTLSAIPLWFGPSTVAGAARFWVHTITVARKQAMRLPHYMEVRFEELVREPVATLQRVCAFLRLDWEPPMVEYHRRSASRLRDETAEWQQEGQTISRQERIDVHPLLHLPPQSERVDRWRTEMDATSLAEFEAIAAETLEMLGYRLSSATSPCGA